MREDIVCMGHANITAAHETTLEVTKDVEVGLNGDCIVGVCADKACADLGIREALKVDGVKIEVEIECGGVCDSLTAHGSKDLTLEDEGDIVIRKSNYVCPRTLAINSDKAAFDLKPELKQALGKGLPVKINIKLEP